MQEHSRHGGWQWHLCRYRHDPSCSRYYQVQRHRREAQLGSEAEGYNGVGSK